MHRKLLGIINVDFDAAAQLLIVHPRDQNAGRSHSVKIGNSSFEMVEELKYLGTTLTNQNYIQEEIKSRLKSGRECWLSFGAESVVFQFSIQKFKG